MHGRLQLQKGRVIQLSAVNGLHIIRAKSQLWEDIKRLSSQMNDPWLIMGDFNSILNTDDRPVGSQVQIGEMKDFMEYVNQCNFIELSIVGRNYTWTNRHVYSRIDKILVNDEWMINMPPKK